MFIEVIRARVNDKYNLGLLKLKVDVNFAQYPQYRPICMPIIPLGKMNQLEPDKYIGYDVNYDNDNSNSDGLTTSMIC